MVQVAQKRTAVLLAIRVKSLIDKKGVTRAQLAQACGVSLESIRTLLDPGLYKTAQIGLVDDVADYFGVSTESLVCLATTQNHLEQSEKKQGTELECDLRDYTDKLKKQLSDTVLQSQKPKIELQPLHNSQVEAKKKINEIFSKVEETVEKLSRPQKNESEGVAATFPVKGGKEWILTGSAVLELQSTYPGVEILKEVREALAWCKANPTMQKTAKGMPRFLNSWMSRASKGKASSVDVDTPKPAEPTKYGYFDVDGPKTPYVKKTDAPEPDFVDIDYPPDTPTLGEPVTEDIVNEPFSDETETFEGESFQPDGADF